MDAYALAYKLARKILTDGKLDAFVANRYASFDTVSGRTSRRARPASSSLRNSCSRNSANPSPSAAGRSISRTW